MNQYEFVKILNIFFARMVEYSETKIKAMSSLSDLNKNDISGNSLWGEKNKSIKFKFHLDIIGKEFARVRLSSADEARLENSIIKIDISDSGFIFLLKESPRYGRSTRVVRYVGQFNSESIDLLGTILTKQFPLNLFDKLKNIETERARIEKINKQKAIEDKNNKLEEFQKLGLEDLGRSWNLTRMNSGKKIEELLSLLNDNHLEYSADELIVNYHSVLPYGIKEFLEPNFFGQKNNKYGQSTEKYRSYLNKVENNKRIYNNLRIAEIKRRKKIKKTRNDLLNCSTDQLSRRNDFAEKIIKANPFEFESICTIILTENGWDARTTKKVGDGGADILAKKNGKKIVVQCKMYTRNITESAVLDAIRGRMEYFAEEAFVVGLRDNYTAKARKWADHDGKIKLMSWEDLLNEN